MNFKEAQCPTCGGILQVPEELEKLTCMYCSKELKSTELLYQIEKNNEENNDKQEIEDSITDSDYQLLELYNKEPLKAIEKAKKIFAEDRFHYSANYILGMVAFPKVLLEHRELAEEFKKNTYEEAMDQYITDSKEFIEYLDRACRVRVDQKAHILSTCVGNMLVDMKETVSKVALESGTKQAFILDDYKMVIALYLIPMILELHLDISEELADIIVKEWILEYPKMPIHKGLYENIKGGFRKKGFCYITTAVCETLQKDDDCYELTMFRNFRDNYILSQEDGEELIWEYYRTAPMIVDNINTLEDSKKIYEGIWQDYLKGCLSAIESGDDAKCKREYSKMVLELEKQYC